MSEQFRVTSRCDVAHSGRENLQHFLPVLLRGMLPLFSIMTLWNVQYAHFFVGGNNLFNFENSSAYLRQDDFNNCGNCFGAHTFAIADIFYFGTHPFVIFILVLTLLLQ